MNNAFVIHQKKHLDTSNVFICLTKQFRSQDIRMRDSTRGEGAICLLSSESWAGEAAYKALTRVRMPMSNEPMTVSR